MQIKLSPFLQWKMNIFLFRIIGWKYALYCLLLLGKLYYYFNKEEKQMIIKAIEEVFANKKYNPELEVIKKNVFQGILIHYYEKLFNAFSSTKELKDFFKICIKNKGFRAIDQGLSNGKGVLLITGHFGGVEYIPTYLGTFNYPVTIIARFSTKHLRERSFHKAKDFSSKIIDADNTKNIVKSILDHLKQNRIVIIQCDEIANWRLSRDTKIRFLNSWVFLDRTINTLTRRACASVVFGVMHRETNLQYCLITTSLEEESGSIPITIGEKVLGLLEEFIYKFPEEWYQWKKISEMQNLSSPSSGKSKSPSHFRIYEPFYGGVS